MLNWALPLLALALPIPAFIEDGAVLVLDGKEEPVEPGRRESETEVKRGVDAELQVKIDQAIAKARKCLADGCSGDGFRMRRIEQLEEQAKQYRGYVEQYRKQAADLKGKDTVKAAQLEQSAQNMERSARSFEQQAQALRQPAAPRKPGAPEPALSGYFQYGLGEEALVGLALIQSGMPPSDSVLQRLWHDAFTSPMPTQHATYAVSLQLMLADAMMHAPCGEAWPPKKDKADPRMLQVRRDEILFWIRKRVEALAGGAHGGAWSYNPGVATAPAKGYAVSGGGPEIGSDALVKKVTDSKSAYDYSNTQYAVLGLKAAALCGVAPKDADSLWRQVVQQFLMGQEPEGPEATLLLEPERGKGREPEFMKKGWEEAHTGGRKRKARSRGWGYTRPPNPSPQKKPGVVQYVPRATATMTAAGLTALLVGRSELKLTSKESERVDEGVRDGLAWAQEHWAQMVASSGYMTYGLERLGVLGSLRSIGGHEWYVEGARSLVDSQKDDGSWQGGYSSPVETSFCLLFLTRGTRLAYAKPSYDIGEASEDPPKSP